LEHDTAREPLLTDIPGDWPRLNWSLLESFTDSISGERDYIRIKWKHFEFNDVGHPVGKSAVEPLAEAMAAIRAIRDWTLIERMEYLDDELILDTPEMKRERIQWIANDGSARLGYFNVPDQVDWVAFELRNLKYTFVATGRSSMVQTSNFSCASYSESYLGPDGAIEALTLSNVLDFVQRSIDSIWIDEGIDDYD